MAIYIFQRGLIELIRPISGLIKDLVVIYIIIKFGSDWYIFVDGRV